MNNNILKHYGMAVLSLMMLPVLTGCSDETPDLPDAGPRPEVTEVPITILLEHDWSIDTDGNGTSRAAPPGAGGTDSPDPDMNGEDETKNINKVQVVTFRRKDSDSNTSGDNAAFSEAEPFIYDATNSMVLDVDTEYAGEETDRFNDTDKHKVARGRLKKVYGYEYRVVAIAYDSNLQSSFSTINRSDKCVFNMPDGENNWFELNLNDGITIDEFKARIFTYNVTNDDKSWRDFISGSVPGIIIPQEDDNLSYRTVQIPQLFYGECYTESGGKNEIIKYSYTDSIGEQVKNLEVTGILYRGLAKVELRITPTSKRVINTDHAVEWICLMADNVFTTVGLSDYDCFLRPSDPAGGMSLRKYTPVAYCNVADGSQKIITAYMLPCKTHLAVRIKTDDNDIRNAQLKYMDWESWGGNGTGIITPDVHDNIFYLRRNHKYILTVSNSEGLFQ